MRFQWDLVCKREYLKDLSQTILTVGVMFGAMGFTTLSDYLGRKPVFLFSQWAMVVVGVATAFVPNYYVFLVLRFCTGALQQVHTMLLISTPSLGVYSCQHLTLSVCLSVCPDVCLSRSFKLLLFCFSMHRAIFWPSVLHVAFYKTLFFDF